MTLREARVASGLRQKELAGRLNVDQAAVSNWERGVNPPLRKYHGALCRALRVKPTEIDELKELYK